MSLPQDPSPRGMVVSTLRGYAIHHQELARKYHKDFRYWVRLKQRDLAHTASENRAKHSRLAQYFLFVLVDLGWRGDDV